MATVAQKNSGITRTGMSFAADLYLTAKGVGTVARLVIETARGAKMDTGLSYPKLLKTVYREFKEQEDIIRENLK